MITGSCPSVVIFKSLHFFGHYCYYLLTFQPNPATGCFRRQLETNAEWGDVLYQTKQIMCANKLMVKAIREKWSDSQLDRALKLNCESKNSGNNVVPSLFILILSATLISNRI